MTASNVGPGGVRNLRAMFENKASDQSTSPPSRGRSPNGSVSSSHSRPVSKVRTSFIAVEKPGEGDHPSQLRLRKASDVTMDSTTEHAVVDGSDLGEILKGSPFEERPAPMLEHDSQSGSNGVSDRAAAMVKKMQQGDGKPAPTVQDILNVSPDEIIKPRQLPRPKPRSHVQTNQPSGTNNTPQAGDAKASPTTPKGPIVKPRGGGPKVLGILESAARAREGRAATAAEADSKDRSGYTEGTEESAEQPREKPKTTASGIPAIPRGGPAKIQAVLASSERAKAGRASTAADTKKGSATPSAASRPPRTSLPARSLPSAATAATASSVAKTDSKPAETKASDKKPVARAAPRVANATTASSLAKKASRTSLNPNDSSKSRTTTSRPADEGFLARMTRPTASSAQKAHDKVAPPSPPQTKQNSAGKSLSAKPSRKSLSRADMNKESSSDVPDVPAVPEIPATTQVQDTTEEVKTSDATDETPSQPAEVEAST